MDAADCNRRRRWLTITTDLARHNHIGHNYIAHTDIGHKDIGHDNIGHRYIGHNSLTLDLASLVVLESAERQEGAASRERSQ